MKDTIPVGGFCNLSNQCTGSNNSGICENGRCTCAKEFSVTDLACEKSHPNNFGIESSNSQQHGNRTYGGASSAQISYRNDKKRDVAMFSPYSFAKETQEYNLSEKQENKRTDDVYNHLHEHTEQVDLRPRMRCTQSLYGSL
uniref:EB domain-containing protein n=1 Tax=Magallana gigas TaxID=29159 RepID=A0A8W8LTX9_MAGGI